MLSSKLQSSNFSQEKDEAEQSTFKLKREQFLNKMFNTAASGHNSPLGDLT